eukprot:196748-Prorocentrum_lima.AAC.1
MCIRDSFVPVDDVLQHNCEAVAEVCLVFRNQEVVEVIVQEVLAKDVHDVHTHVDNVLTDAS